MKDQPIIWANILNYKHSPMFTYDLCSFAALTKKIGYPYFNWNDRIYNTDTGEDTGCIVVNGNVYSPLQLKMFRSYQQSSVSNSTKQTNYQLIADIDESFIDIEETTNG